ncbi:MAG: metal-dependent transcriptional regulator [Planctomycetes bacterium]|nr:metal-dependent transcriptional regulator [Planctomycetota bacterium]
METWKEFDQNIITHSAAHHLMAVDDLIHQFGYARVSDIARELSITRGSVSISLKPLKEAGLLLQDENKHLRLSERGRQLVAAIKTKRVLIQRLLSSVLGVDPTQAEIDACKMEHLVSNATAQRMVSFLKFVESDQDQARRFRECWAAFDPSCAPSTNSCASCSDGCMAERVGGTN